MKTRTRYQRGVIGKVMRFVFIAFNILMLLWFLGGVATVNDAATSGAMHSEARAAGAAIGSFFILMVWGFGALVFGALSYFTRGDAITETIE